MKAFLCLCWLAGLLCWALPKAVRAATWSPLPYYLVNPYDDVVVGPGFLLVSGSRRVAAGVGYSLAQGEARGYLRLRNESGLTRTLGYQLEGFHQVQPVVDVVCRYQTGFYEGRTGFSSGLVHQLSDGGELMLGYTHEKLWGMAGEGSLRPVESDRVEALHLSYRRDGRDDPLNPRAGTLGEVGLTQAAQVFGGTRAYLVARGTWARYEPMGPRGVKAWRLRAATTAGGLPAQRQIWLPS
ncbi:MAG: BamA/TamA family outer membrane protein, partial [Armatimonadota bacterium]|nr:BamA/TamA family outer membrane protein [Armatimonadota bacterium]